MNLEVTVMPWCLEQCLSHSQNSLLAGNGNKFWFGDDLGDNKSIQMKQITLRDGKKKPIKLIRIHLVKEGKSKKRKKEKIFFNR